MIFEHPKYDTGMNFLSHLHAVHPCQFYKWYVTESNQTHIKHLKLALYLRCTQNSFQHAKHQDLYNGGPVANIKPISGPYRYSDVKLAPR